MPQNEISLSQETKAIAKERVKTGSINPFVENVSRGDAPDFEQLVNFLKEESVVHDKKMKLMDHRLITSLLNDIKSAQEKEADEPKSEEKKLSRSTKAKYWGLAIAGATFFACEGFDGITAILGLLSASAGVSLGVALFFSIFSVMVFCGFGLQQIKEHLDVKFKEVPGLIEEYVNQVDELEQILELMKKILTKKNKLDPAEAQHYQAMLAMLQTRNAYIESEKVVIDKARNSRGLNVAKFTMSAVTGILFFSSGFFTGQAVALYVAGLIGSTVAATFPPILAAAVFLGVVALLVYWYLERPGIENLVGRLFKLDDEKIEQIGSDRTTTITNELGVVKSLVDDKVKIQEQEDTLVAAQVQHQQNQAQLKEVKTERDELKSQVTQKETDADRLHQRLVKSNHARFERACPATTLERTRSLSSFFHEASAQLGAQEELKSRRQSCPI